jgi:putative ABC transport system permease protein
MGGDLKFTWRALRQTPWYSAAVVGVIAVTLALATTVFAIVDGVLFRPLPYPRADRMVVVQPGFKSIPLPSPVLGQVRRYGTSAVDLASWQAAVPDAMFTAYRVQGWSGTGPGINVDIAGVARVRRNFFDVVGVQPLFGGFSDGDYEPNPRVPPVILMYETWQARLGGAPDVIGRTINFEPETGFGLRIVGVMPKGFSFPSADRPTDFITTFELDPKQAGDPKNRQLSEVLARLPDGMTPAMLAQRLGPALAATAVAYPLGPKPEGWSENGWRRQGPFDAVDITPLRQFLSRKSGAMFLAVSGAVALLVLIAAANVSSLMSSRSVERQRELSTRRALGAGPSAIARLWAIESVALVAAGAAIGALAAPPLLHLILALLPDEVALLKPPRLDGRVFGFVAASMIVLSALVAIAPIRRSLRSVSAAKGGSSERVRTTGRFVAVSGQVAAAFVLTVLGACLVGSLLAVYGSSRPITTDGVVVIEGGLRGPGSESAPSRQPRAERIVERLKQTPGVRDVTSLAGQFLVGGGWGGAFRSPDHKSYVRDAETWAVMPGFFDVIGLRAIEGRLPTGDELRSSAPVVVISQRIAQQYWPNGSGVGQTLEYEPPLRSDYYKQPFTVIGVVAEVPWFAWDMESPLFYVPYKYGQTSTLTVLLRTDGRIGPAIDESLRAIAQADPQLRLNRAAALDTLYRDSISLRRFQSWLFGGFAAAALAVAGVGILGLLAMSTARRTKEIGIRCALGATPGSVRRLLVAEQLAAVVVGLVVGGAVAAWAVGFVKSYVYQLSVADPRIWGAAATLILLTAGLGALLPAVRASRIDPVRALRVE